MRYWLTSLLCLVILLTSATCLEDDVTSDPDVDVDTGVEDEEEEDVESAPPADDDPPDPADAGDKTPPSGGGEAQGSVFFVWHPTNIFALICIISFQSAQ